MIDYRKYMKQMLCDKEESYYGKRTAKMSTKITKQLR